MIYKDTGGLKKTPLFESHIQAGAKMVGFAGWVMPLHYSKGIMSEHLTTRRSSGLFDISHMGRIIISGKDGLHFLQYLLTSDAAALKKGESQYTIMSDRDGTALDDAYLYRFYKDSYLIAVNASNTRKDLDHMEKISGGFNDIDIRDVTGELSMLSLQGPGSEEVLSGCIVSGKLPGPGKNKSGILDLGGREVLLARTGYTGEPLGFELFIDNNDVKGLWEKLVAGGAFPAGLGARDTLRLEAALPLYGHELGISPQGDSIPVFASDQAGFAVSFSGLKGDFMGRNSLKDQARARSKMLRGDFSGRKDLPAVIKKLELVGKGIARPGDKIYLNSLFAGYVTSGTVIPYWVYEDREGVKKNTGSHRTRAIALALTAPEVGEGEIVETAIRGKRVEAIVMSRFLYTKSPPFSYPVTAADIMGNRQKDRKE